MAVDRTKLKERVDPIEGHQIDAERIEDLLEGNLKITKPIDVWASRHEEHTNIEVRTIAIDGLIVEHTQTVVGPRPEKVDRQEVEPAADLVQSFHPCLHFESTTLEVFLPICESARGSQSRMLAATNDRTSDN
jgi:hypothetical protein